MPHAELVTASQKTDDPMLQAIQTIIVLGIIKDLDKF